MAGRPGAADGHAREPYPILAVRILPGWCAAVAEQKLLLRRHQLEHRRVVRPTLPESPSVLRGMLEEELGRLTIESPAFGNLMGSLVPEIYGALGAAL